MESVLYLLKKGGPVSVREVQKALKFSSSSVANHHLEQLRELGLVKKQDVGGYYSLVAEVKIGILRHYVKLGKVLFPRFLFYAIFFTTCLRRFCCLWFQGFRVRTFSLLCLALWFVLFSGMRHNGFGLCVRTNL